MASHDWHLCDVERGYEVRRYDDAYQIRDRDGNVVDLTATEFEQFRLEGPNPKGLK